MLTRPHTTAAGVFAGAAAGTLYVMVQMLYQTRSLTWLAQMAALAALEYAALGLVYRLTLHPLAKHPGPLVAACTDWWIVFWVGNGSRHLELYRQHKIHGKFLRYAPNRISVNSGEGSRDLHDVNANTFKSEVYGAFKRFFGAEMSLTTVDHKIHAFRRRVNGTALNPTATKNFEPRVTPHVDYLCEIVREGAEESGEGPEAGWSSGKDMADYIAHCIADIMGDVTFSQHWNVQREAKNRHFVHDLPQGVAGMHLIGHMQSLFLFNMHKILFKPLIDGVMSLMELSRSFSNTRLAQHQRGIVGNDIWQKLLDAKDPETGRAFTPDELVSEASLLIIGGTDGMITATTGTLFYLLHNPHALERLTREIREAFPPKEDGSCPIRFASPELQKISYLPACIDESMRISPPVPSILPRRAGPGGITVDGEWFPEGTNLGIPHYALQRNPEVFPEPLAYRPERFMPGELSNPKDVKLRPAVGQAFSFTPFGAGRSSCIGKYMAYQEMSYILARLIWEYDLRLEPGNTTGEGTGKGPEGRDRKDEFQIYCCFVSRQQGPVAQFRRRKDLGPVKA